MLRDRNTIANFSMEIKTQVEFSYRKIKNETHCNCKCFSDIFLKKVLSFIYTFTMIKKEIARNL